MQRRSVWLLTAGLVLGCWCISCATVQAPPPRLPQVAPPPLARETSQVEIPLTISLSSLQDLLETVVPGQFTDQSSFNLPLDWGPLHAQAGVEATYTVTRGPFEVSVVDGKLVLEARIEGQVALTLKADPHVHSSGRSTIRLGLRGKLAWERNQRLRVQWTRDLSVESAEARLGYHFEFHWGEVSITKDFEVPVPARALVEQQLSPLLDRMVAALNDQANSLSFAQEFQKAWGALAVSIPMGDPAKTSLSIRPLSLVSSELTSDGKNLNFKVGAQVSAEAEDPGTRPPARLGPVPEILVGPPDGFRVPWRTALPYAAIVAEFRHRFVGRPLSLAGPNGPAEFTVENLSLAGTGNLLVVGVDFRSRSPDANGRMYLIGTVMAGVNAAVVAQMQQASDTRDLLKDRLTPLAQPSVVATVTSALNAVLRDQSATALAEARHRLERDFSGRKLAPGAILQVRWDDATLRGVSPAPSQILFDVVASGEASLRVDGLRFAPSEPR